MAILELINDEDSQVAAVVRRAIPKIAALVDAAEHALRGGGRVLFLGAGTSGRLGVLEAAECPPTFGTSPTVIRSIMAGGLEALFNAQEDLEDSDARGAADIAEAEVSRADLVVGLSASGTTPYVVGGLRESVRRGAATAAIVCSHARTMTFADHLIRVIVGPEVLTGSTRMKAGTAQKLVLNMLTTTAMVRLGKVYGNLMVDLRPTNRKLRGRATRLVALAADTSTERAAAALKAADNSPKVAILSLLTGVSPGRAREILSSHDWDLRRSLQGEVS